MSTPAKAEAAFALSPLDAIRTCLGNYATFSGRASRPEFWWFAGATTVIPLAMGLADFIRQRFELYVYGTFGDTLMTAIDTLLGLLALGLCLPFFAAASRRLHDTGRSARSLGLGVALCAVGYFVLVIGVLSAGIDPWTELTTTQEWLLLGFLAVCLAPGAITALVILLWLAMPSQPDTNIYGPNPHKVTT